MRHNKTRTKLLGALDWREAQKRGQLNGVARIATLQRGADGKLSFVASTAAPDRYGDTVNQAGWKTDAYEKNPVMLWAHDYSAPPVAKAGMLDKSGDLTVRGIEFTPPEMNAFGAQVGEMVAAGFLNAVSVGFLPLKWEERYNENGSFAGFNFIEQELLEISIVPVPANPQALVEGKAFTKALASWASESAPSDGVAVEYRAKLQAMLRAADDAAQRAADAGDADAFAEMLALLRSIDARLEALNKSIGAPPLVRGSPTEDAVPTTIAGAFKHLLGRR